MRGGSDGGGGIASIFLSAYFVMASTTLDELPEAAVVAILQRTDSTTLLRSVALTSRRLRALASSEVGWHHK